mgnify:FL=1|jgi:hypothetical protein
MLFLCKYQLLELVLVSQTLMDTIKEISGGNSLKINAFSQQV